MCEMRFLIGFLIPLLVGTTQAAIGDAALTLFKSRCVKCHGKDGKVKGELNLLEIKTVEQLTGDFERLKTILEILDASEMPPEKEPPLKPETRAAAVADLQKLLRAATAGTEFAPTPIRRMNRLQYNNAVQDLFRLKGFGFSATGKNDA